MGLVVELVNKWSLMSFFFLFVNYSEVMAGFQFGKFPLRQLSGKTVGLPHQRS